MSSLSTPRRATAPLALVAAAALVAGCPDAPKKPSPGTGSTAGMPKPAKPAKPADPAVADIPYDPGKAADPARRPRKLAAPALKVAARYVLVSARKAGGKAAAGRRAERIAALARQKGQDFGQLVQRYSDAKPALKQLKWVVSDETEGVPDAVFAAAKGIGVGQVADPVRCAGGLAVVQRAPLEEYSTAHILITFKGGKLPGKRSKADAQARAEKLAKRAKEAKDFHLLVSRTSDSPSKVRGGIIAPIRPDRLLPGFEPYLEAVRKLPENGISEVVETPYGFHVIKRLPFKRIQVRHILLRHRELEGKGTPVDRSRDEARKLARKLLAKVREPGADFAALAKKHSEGPSAARGGLVVPIARGEAAPRFEQYAFALKVGAISGVVESSRGFHIIKRER